MTTTTTVNDNRVDLGATASQNGGETRARRLAADLPRNDDRIREVRSSVTDYALVWLADEKVSYRPPDGYNVTRVFRSSDGSVAVELEKVDE